MNQVYPTYAVVIIPTKTGYEAVIRGKEACYPATTADDALAAALRDIMAWHAVPISLYVSIIRRREDAERILADDDADERVDTAALRQEARSEEI